MFKQPLKKVDLTPRVKIPKSEAANEKNALRKHFFEVKKKNQLMGGYSF
jgi:hypothetical protein